MDKGSESVERGKMEQRKRARQNVLQPRGGQRGYSRENKTPMAMYLITRILAAKSAGDSGLTPIDNRTCVFDQVGHILDSDRLSEMRRQMVVCWNEGWHPSPARITIRTNKSKLPLAMELGWINARNELRLKKKHFSLGESQSCINSDLIEDEVKRDKNIFFVYGANGSQIIEEHLMSKGWRRTMDVKEFFKLKWVENKSQVKYNLFREGEQMANHIPSTWRLSNKIQLVGILKDLEANQRPGLLKVTEVIPETYRLNLVEEQFKFRQIYRDGDVWICKPAALNQGRGIYLIRKLDDVYQRSEQSPYLRVSRSFHLSGNRVVQRYIKNPLLLNGRKADIRCFMLIASTSPFLILSHPGYVRLSCKQYDVESEEMGIHLTNQFVQKKDACYSYMKDDTIWSIDQLNAYMNRCNLPPDWVLNVMIVIDSGVDLVSNVDYGSTQIRRLMLHCFLAVRTHLEAKVGLFELLGFDFVVDEKLKVWLLEVNVNPSLCTDCQVLRDLIPDLLRETLDICIECFEKNKRRRALMPLKAVSRFNILYCGERNYPWPLRRVSRSASNLWK